MQQTKTINWVLYHQPIDLFLRTAESFAKEINTLTNGRITVKIYSLEDYCKEHYNGKVVDPITLMERGEVHMSQTQVGYLGQAGANDFYALEMPFLFNNHEHATRVLEGTIGENLLASLVEKTPVRGLAFTYSGGFRVIASRQPITTAEQLEGLQMAVKTNPVFTDTVKALGCVHSQLIEFDAIENENNEIKSSKALETADLCQTTAVRYQNDVRDPSKFPYVIDSQHSMYLTSILISETLWQSLSDAEQRDMKSAAMNASRLERTWSVNDADEILNSSEKQKELGIKSILSFDENEVIKLKNKVQSVYSKYNTVFTPGLLKEIQSA